MTGDAVFEGEDDKWGNSEHCFQFLFSSITSNVIMDPCKPAVHRLPHDILSTIFILVNQQPFSWEDVFVTSRAKRGLSHLQQCGHGLSHVCHAWRQVAHDTRQRWSCPELHLSDM
jgi:hypothetical protein